MKARDVLRLLQISRATLTKYVKQGSVKVVNMPNGRYNYDDESVFNLLNKGVPRKNYIYCRVSTDKQKGDLENQVNTLLVFCKNRGIIVDGVFKDIKSGINFDRKMFNEMFSDIINNSVKTVYVTNKDRLSRIGFSLFTDLFAKFGTSIVVINDFFDERYEEKEIFTEIISLLHCFSMKMYSKRRQIFKVLSDEKSL